MAHSSKEYMKEYLKRQRDRARAFNEAYDLLDQESSADLLKRVILEQVDAGKSLEDAEDFYKSHVSADMWQEYLDSKGVEWAKGDTHPVTTDSIPESKPDCFGKQFHKDSEKCTCSLKDDCHKAWVANLFKPKAVKEAETRRKIIDFLADSKALVDGVERRERAELWAKVKAITDAEEKAFDTRVKYYTDQGVPEATARQSATWEMKKEKAKATQQFREIAGKRELMTDAEKTAEKMKLLKDSKKLREGDAHE